METVEKLNKLKIYSSFTLSADDTQCLSLLYAPLIEIDALGLYLGFSSMVERNNLKSVEITHQDLYDIFNLSAKKFMQIRRVLEAIGLIESYVDIEKNYVYVLKPPVSAKTFLSDGTLGLYLYGKVGEKIFKMLQKHFEIDRINKSELKNISANFDDIFSSQVPDYYKIGNSSEYFMNRKPNSNVSFGKYSFDFAKFNKMIDTQFISKSESDKFEKTIVSTSYVYGFSEEQMAGIYLDSINKSNLFDFKLLKQKANILYQYLHNVKAPLLEKNDDNDSIDQLANELEKATVLDILDSIGITYPGEYLKTLNEIHATIELPRGLINCMIMHVLKEKSGELPSVQYFKKVADSWVLKGIITTKDAIEYTTNKKSGVKSTKGYSSNKADVKHPEWVDDYISDLKKGF